MKQVTPETLREKAREFQDSEQREASASGGGVPSSMQNSRRYSAAARQLLALADTLESLNERAARAMGK